MVEQLPIVGWALESFALFVSDACKRLGQSPGATIALTPHAPAQSALDELRREVEALRAEREGIKAKLRDPTTVHVGMLRGDIAKPELRSLLHVYSVEAVAQFDRGAIDTTRASTNEGVGPVLQPKGNSYDN